MKLLTELTRALPGWIWSSRGEDIHGRPVPGTGYHLEHLRFRIEPILNGHRVTATGSLDRNVPTDDPLATVRDLIREAHDHYLAIEADKASQREELVKRKLWEAQALLHARFRDWEFELKLATCPRTNEERHALTGVHQRLDHLGGLAFRIFWDAYNPGGAVPDAYFVEAGASWDESPWMVPTWRKQFISRDVCECVDEAIYFAATETKRRRREEVKAAD